MIRVINFILVLLLGACAGEEAPTGAPVAPDTVSPQLDMMWGALDESAELGFTLIRSFTVDGEGRLLVYDNEQDIRVFSPEGGFIRTLARRGQGPGEVRYVPAMAYGSGTLVVWDAGNQRISIWDESLEFVTSFPTPRYWAAYGEASITILDGGVVWLKLAPDASTAGQGFPRPEYVRPWPQRPDTLWVHAPAAACDKVYDFSYRRGFWADVRLPWFPSVVSALGPGGELYLGCNEDFQFKKYTGGDSTTFARHNRELRVTEDERRFFETTMMPPLGTLPDLRPEYSRIIPSSDGKVWAFETSQPQWQDVSGTLAAATGYDSVLVIARSGGRFSVFDEGGRFIAVVPLPPDVRYSGFPTTAPVLIRGDTLWAVRRGEFDEEYLARYIVPIEKR